MSSLRKYSQLYVIQSADSYELPLPCYRPIQLVINLPCIDASHLAFLVLNLFFIIIMMMVYSEITSKWSVFQSTREASNSLVWKCFFFIILVLLSWIPPSPPWWYGGIGDRNLEAKVLGSLRRWERGKGNRDSHGALNLHDIVECFVRVKQNSCELMTKGLNQLTK